MLKEIEEIRRSLIALNALDDEAQEALATLEAAMEEIDRHPAAGRVREVVTNTAGTLAVAEPDREAGLAAKWDELKEELKEQVDDWEQEHPSIVLAIGRVSNSLAAFGL